ncbi:uncharacterized protein PGTG_13791 [Puccinia graminis f. sp. tritici CRL 75-36-700-3]|uniref:Uncharacterized protein n=1 Tax=Puccinia graminis f. sp. tritici (strain CRL 75-36-700-3 / race SCCL) TaxID=418459 RepID=E3KUN7_PUCGT|nr:uncharacterized protein PGTG_13791 [Puccinia graminis f. sp. tritici CRL 75-36-700-3]EFP87987.1 hypothetical protein PGTG_13791 [Puccinia graminis f. sp. tritici CRL 75-36-700-3]
MPHKRAKASIRKAESLRKGFDLPPNQHANKKKKRKEKHEASRVKTYEISQDIPKNMFRILNAEKIRAEYKIRKSQDPGSLALPKPSSSSSSTPNLQRSNAPSSSSKRRNKSSAQMSKAHDELKILPGEGLGSFNRRVEAALRPKVTAVMKAAKNKLATKKPEATGEPSTVTAPAGPMKETTSIAAESVDEESPKGTTKPVKHFAPRPSRFPITDVAMEPPSLSLTKAMKKNLASSAASSPLPISAAQKRSLELERDKVIKRYRQMKEERYAHQL